MALAEDTTEGIRIECHCGNEFIHVRIPHLAGRNPSLCDACRQAGRPKPKAKREIPYVVPDIEGFPEVPDVTQDVIWAYEREVTQQQDENALLAGELANEKFEMARLQKALLATEKLLIRAREKSDRTRSQAAQDIYDACRPKHPSDIALTIDRRVRIRDAMDSRACIAEHIRELARARSSPSIRRLDALLELATDCVQEIARIQRSNNSA